MSALPPGWCLLELDALKAREGSSLVGGPFGSDLTQKDYLVEPGVPVIRGSNLDGKNSRFIDDGFVYVSDRKARELSKNLAFPGDVIFTQRGTLGQVAVIPAEARFDRYVISQSQMKLTPAANLADSNYLHHYFRFPRTVERLLSETQSTGVPHINLGILKRFRVLIPPLAEQRRIAAILDRSDALRARRRAALAQVDTLTQSIFLDMFGDPAVNINHWCELALAEICHVKGGKRLPKGEEYSSHPTRFRYVRVTDIKSGAVDEKALVYLKPEVQAKISRYIVNDGDVIISIAGSIGLIAPVRASLDGANLTENAAKLAPRSRGHYDSIFLAELLKSKFVQDQIASQIGQVTIGKLALFRIEQLRVLLPPIDRQREFRRRVESLATLRLSQGESLSHFDALFASLQHRAFRGEL